MNRVNSFDVDLAFYKNISMWSPQVGDAVIYNGWVFGRWFGIINNINADGSCSIVKGGLPILMLTQNGKRRKKNTITVDIQDIKTASAGAYSIVRSEGNLLVWYV